MAAPYPRTIEIKCAGRLIGTIQHLRVGRYHCPGLGTFRSRAKAESELLESWLNQQLAERLAAARRELLGELAEERLQLTVQDMSTDERLQGADVDEVAKWLGEAIECESKDTIQRTIEPLVNRCSGIAVMHDDFPALKEAIEEYGEEIKDKEEYKAMENQIANASHLLSMAARAAWGDDVARKDFKHELACAGIYGPHPLQCELAYDLLY